MVSATKGVHCHHWFTVVTSYKHHTTATINVPSATQHQQLHQSLSYHKSVTARRSAGYLSTLSRRHRCGHHPDFLSRRWHAASVPRCPGWPRAARLPLASTKVVPPRADRSLAPANQMFHHYRPAWTADGQDACLVRSVISLIT